MAKLCHVVETLKKLYKTLVDENHLYQSVVWQTQCDGLQKEILTTQRQNVWLNLVTQKS